MRPIKHARVISVTKFFVVSFFVHPCSTSGSECPGLPFGCWLMRERQRAVPRFLSPRNTFPFSPLRIYADKHSPAFTIYQPSVRTIALSSLPTRVPIQFICFSGPGLECLVIHAELLPFPFVPFVFLWPAPGRQCLVTISVTIKAWERGKLRTIDHLTYS